MGHESFSSNVKGRANFRLCKVSSYMTELLEIQAEQPTLHVLVIPGNPGIISYYKDFVESLYVLLGENASVTAIGHIGQTKKNWGLGRLFSLEEQIEHKMDFIKQELQSIEVPIILVGHSIGSYISIEMFKRSPEKVTYCVGLYPFLAVNPQSFVQPKIKKIAASQIFSTIISLIVAFIGLLPIMALKLIVAKSVGKSWSDYAVEATCTHLVQYHVMRNVLYMAMTEFEQLKQPLDWQFIRGKQGNFAFLFGVDDHWGPLEMYEEISKQAPNIALSIEREDHTHSFCCTAAGSLWVARHVARLVKDHTTSSSQ